MDGANEDSEFLANVIDQLDEHYLDMEVDYKGDYSQGWRYYLISICSLADLIPLYKQNLISGLHFAGMMKKIRSFGSMLLSRPQTCIRRWKRKKRRVRTLSIIYMHTLYINFTLLHTLSR